MRESDLVSKSSQNGHFTGGDLFGYARQRQASAWPNACTRRSEQTATVGRLSPPHNRRERRENGCTAPWMKHALFKLGRIRDAGGFGDQSNDGLHLSSSCARQTIGVPSLIRWQCGGSRRGNGILLTMMPAASRRRQPPCRNALLVKFTNRCVSVPPERSCIHDRAAPSKNLSVGDHLG